MLTTNSGLASTPRTGDKSGIALEQVDCGRAIRMETIFPGLHRQVKQLRWKTRNLPGLAARPRKDRPRAP